MIRKMVHSLILLFLFLGISGRVALSIAGPDLPPIAGRYESSITTKEIGKENMTREWFLWREPNQIEVFDKLSGEGEMWQLGKNGDVIYLAIDHEEKIVIEYTSGDLRLLQRTPEWHLLERVVDINSLRSNLKVRGEADILGRNSSIYKGQMKGIEYEMWWLEREQMPAMVRQVYSDRVVTLTLKEIYPIHESPWPYGRHKDYRYIDYADIGDKESDPVLKRLLHKDNHVHAHAHER